jgi:4-diphosphocytidyl-2-C-methyl-D-erythritol kinase
MPMVAEAAYAKINLALHVRRRRDDGYHDLETLFAFVDAGDRLTATESNDIDLGITGPFGDNLRSDENNLVLQTANLLRRHYGVQSGAMLTLEKNLPISSGIGGGSADAAATARLLNRLWRLSATDGELAALLAPLGADVPACIASKTVVGRGTGTVLDAVDDNVFSGMPVLLVNPLKPVSTAAIFSRWDGVDRGGLNAGVAMAAMLDGRNDLEPAAISLCPEIARILSVLRDTTPLLARMSGSGATCFALYRDANARDAAKASLTTKYWTLAGTLR